MDRKVVIGLLLLGWVLLVSAFHFQQFVGPLMRLLGRG